MPHVSFVLINFEQNLRTLERPYIALKVSLTLTPVTEEMVSAYCAFSIANSLSLLMLFSYF